MISAMDAQRLHYSKLSHDQLILNNLVCGLHSEFVCRLGGHSCKISLQPSFQKAQYDVQLVFSCEGISSQFYFPSALFSSVVIGQTSLSDVLENLPDILLTGAIGMAIEPIMKELRAQLQKDIQCTAVKLISEQPAIESFGAGLNVAVEGANYTGFFTASPQILQWLNDVPVVSREFDDRLPCLIDVEIGSTIMGEQALRAMNANDIILVQRSRYISQSQLILRLSKCMQYIVEVDKNQVTLTEVMEQKVMNDELDPLDMDMELPSASDGTEGAIPLSSDDIDGIPVKLTFNLGHLELTLGDIRKLQPGFTFQLNRSVASPVLIKANGKPFAEAELVDINQQLGARITRLV